MLGKELSEYIDLETLIEKDFQILSNIKIDCPEINVGDKANLTLFDPSIEWVFKETDIKSMSKNTPFVDEILKGKPLAIYNNSANLKFVRIDLRVVDSLSTKPYLNKYITKRYVDVFRSQ